MPSELSDTTDVGLRVRRRATQVDYRLAFIWRDKFEMSLFRSGHYPIVFFGYTNDVIH
jgi:hypothetical protein